MKPFFSRIGSKRDLADTIIEMMPEHKRYVEVFFGGGAVYWRKEPSQEEYVNDLDKELMDDYALMQKAKSDPKLYEKYKDLKTLPVLQKFYFETPVRTLEGKLIKTLIKRNNGFGSVPFVNFVQKPINPYTKAIALKDYKDRMKNTTFLSTDYKNVIKKLDSKTTFFFMDPPYENSKRLYEHDRMDFSEMAEILHNIKGTFLLTINDSPLIRTAFKGFVIKSITVKPKGARKVGSKPRKELIITNYRF